MTPLSDERPQSPFWRSALVLIVASLCYCAPLFFNLDKWGRQDWDQFSFRSETPRLALLRDHVLPTWNPYAEGGTVLLAHPHSPVLSPWFGIVLLFGAPIGLRIQVTVFVALGAIGMALFLARLGASRRAGIVGGILFMMSAHFALHIAEGHLEWCVLGLMPWVAWHLLRIGEGRRPVVLAAILLASVFTFGVVYIPVVYLPFLSAFAFFETVRARDWRPLVGWLAIVAIAALLSSIKLLPTADFARQYPRAEAADEPGSSRQLLLTGLFDPRQVSFYRTYRHHMETRSPAVRGAPLPQGPPGVFTIWNAHEYATYIGVVGIALAAIGGLRTARRFWPLYLAGVLAGMVAMGNVAPIDLWSWLKQLPFYSQLNVPTRFLAAVVFVLAVAGGFGFDTVMERLGRTSRQVRSIVGIALIVLLYGELARLGWDAFSDIFVVPQVIGPRHSDFAQRRPTALEGRPPTPLRFAMYAHLQANSGTLEGYENLSVTRGRVLTTDDPNYRGEVYLETGSGRAETEIWTMSSVTVRVDARGADTLTLNQNFDPGWKARLDVVPAARGRDGLVSVDVSGEHARVELFYLPQPFVIGAGISVATLIALAGVWLGDFRRRASSAAGPIG
jgi:hypothetical protein